MHLKVNRTTAMCLLRPARWALTAAAVVWLLVLSGGISRGQVTCIFTNSHPQPTLQGLVGTYFNNIYLTNAVFSRNDSAINFNWGTGSPDPRINPDNFSVRWTGQIVPCFSGNYSFYTTNDDGIRVWIDNQLLIDSWVDQGVSSYNNSNSISLAGGVRHSLKVEYYEHTQAAVAQLWWSGPYFAEQIVGDLPNAAGGTGRNDAFGQTLASLGGGQFAVGAPAFTVFFSGTAYSGAGRVWTGDLTGTVGVCPASPAGFYSFIGGGSFGNSLAVTANGSLLIGTPTQTAGNGFTGWITNQGAVYGCGSQGNPYVRDPSNLAQSYFGEHVAALGGGPSQWAASSRQGAGRVYLFTNNNASVSTIITNPNPTTASGFGSALSGLGTNRVLISSPNDSVAGDKAGSVFIYDYAGNLLRTIHNVGGHSGNGFGTALVSVDDHRFLVGSPGSPVTYISGGQLLTNSAAGLVYMYDDSGTRLLTLTNSEVSSSALFGYSIAMLGPGRILVGSPYDTINSLGAAGRVLLYNVTGLHLETITKPSPVANDVFGWSVCALDDRHFVVGSPGDSTHDIQAGAIYGYDAPVPSADLGSEIPRPDSQQYSLDVSGNFAAQGPAVTPAGAAFWHAQSQKLFAVKPGGILVSWPLLGGGTYNWQASISWPTNQTRYQVHVAGQTPVDLTSAGSYSNIVLEATTTDASASSVAATRLFSATIPGTSFLMISAGDPASNAIRFQLVQSIVWNNPAYLYDSAPATVGQPIADPGGFHDTAAGSPQVVLPNSVYCPAPVFDPTTRTGTIIPVNVMDPTQPTHDLVVAFYQRGTLLFDPVTGLAVSNSIFWPYQPVRFNPQWPTNAPHLIIASQQGTGLLDPATYQNWQLYYQNDTNQAGFNPNDEHAMRLPYGGGEAVFALRSDLGTPQTSQPFVLIRYQDPSNGGQWRMKAWQVVAQEAPYFFNYPAQAGALLQPPFPLSLLAPEPQTAGVSGPYWRDRKLSFWAKAAGDNGGHTNIVMHYFYPLQSGFFYPGSNPPPVGSSIPLLDLQAGTPGTPIDVAYDTSWPSPVPQLRAGETLVKAKFGLPDISSQTSAEILYQQAAALGQGNSVQLIDPTREYGVSLSQLPSDVQTTSLNGLQYFTTLPPQLYQRFYYNPTTHQLRFKGQFIQPPAGEYYLLLNVLTARETGILLGLSTDSSFQSAVNALAALTANVTTVPPDSTGFDSMALTAGAAQGQGYVTLAFGNNPILSPPAEPVSLYVIQVTCPDYQGEIKVIQSDNPFDEKITMRHSGDFGGKTDSNIFEWRTLPPVNGLPSTSPPDQWTSFSPTPATGQGAVDITIQGPGLFTLSDNYFICRWRPSTAPLCVNGTNTLGWSDWTAPMLAPGWIKRVLAGINPFEQRIQNYQNTTVNTIVSMISQAGPPYAGPIALNQQNANNFGLIQTYETVLRRGMSLSINGAPPVNYDPANSALLLAAGRLADLYMLLGNEAYADAEDPTIAIGTSDPTFGAQATSIHCFQNQTASLMEEELDLLRGRDNSLLPSTTTYPFYNRLIWNFTQGTDGGEVAYALNYNIRAQGGSVSGTISAADAQALYPQGHGDAWGHYLSAIKSYYFLLRNPNFTWLPEIESVLVGGVPVSVGYEHERKFAAAAAARARTGAELVNLTYRNAYVENPNGQWQGYTDSNTNRAWGLAEWGSRAGQGAFFDWVTANAILPDVDADPSHTGIQKIDRTTVKDLSAIVSALGDIQTKVDQADAGLNPLGLAKNVVPFDIDPTLIAQGQTHFEQIYSRALVSLNNAVTVFNRANNCTQLLRQQADSVADFQSKTADQEADFNSRLIEAFGYPYAEDIGPTGAYPTGYNGPDIYHFNYVEGPSFTGVTNPPAQTVTVTIQDANVGSDGGLSYTTHNVLFNFSTLDLSMVKPAGWTSRQAPGQIQISYDNLIQSYTRFQKALTDYNNLIAQIQDRSTLLAIQYNVSANQISIMYANRDTQEDLDQHIEKAKSIADMDSLAAKKIALLSDAQLEALPKVVGLATDPSGALRAIIKTAEAAAALNVEGEAAGAQEVALQYEHDKEIASLQEQIQLTISSDQVSLTSDAQQFAELVRQESSSRLELYGAMQVLQQSVGQYSAAVAGGERLLADRLRFRQQTAAQIQQYRYKDMAFRIFRNDALQKYRAQFDFAAMYVYLSARAYDYETNLKLNDPRGPGSAFMSGIVQAQSLGIIQNNAPQIGGSGDGTLATPMASMNQDWLALRGQLQFNNPQNETGRFSLRSEMFRIQAGSAGSKVWRDTLTRNVVPNLLTLPEFTRFCIPFQPQQPVEPALVIPFSTTINFGQNFFGWPLGGGDNTYDSTHFATKIRSVGVWFANYNSVSLSSTPHVYLIPIGEDVMRSPSSNLGDVRSWKILDQSVPVPFQLTTSSLSSPSWMPQNTLSEQMANARLYPEFRAYTDSGTFDVSQVISNYRLIGRSVWNTRWLLIIPAGELLSDRNEAIQRFINGSLLPDGTRDGNGVTDIKIFFQTYAYSGN